MIINGVLLTVVAAAAGGVLFEGLKLLDRWVKNDNTLGKKAIVWSAAMVVVGSLVPLIYGVKERNFLEVAQLGVAIPALITGGFKLTSKPDDIPVRDEGATPATAKKAAKGGGTRGRVPSKAKKQGGAIETTGGGFSSVKKRSEFIQYAGWRF